MAIFYSDRRDVPTLKRWEVLLNGKMSLDNLAHYLFEGSIEAGQETQITHDLGVVPQRWIVVEARGSNALIRGVAWNSSVAAIKNMAMATTFTGKILFLP